METDRLETLYGVGARALARPPGQEWDQTAVTFANWLSIHDKNKVLETV